MVPQSPGFYIAPRKGFGRRICERFAQVAGGRVLGAPPKLDPRHLPAFWGVDHTTTALFAAARSGGRFLYLDHCYFGPRRAHIRITWDRIQHPGTGRGDPDRFRRLGIPIEPWRGSGGHIVIAPPGDPYLSATGAGFTSDAWGRRVKAQIYAQTDRPFVYRFKPTEAQPGRPLRCDLAGAHCLITHLSATAIEAALMGIPVFVTAPDAAAAPVAADLWSGDLERPRTDVDREIWAAVLAANQWTQDEIASGRAGSDLRASDGDRR